MKTSPKTRPSATERKEQLSLMLSAMEDLEAQEERARAERLGIAAELGDLEAQEERARVERWAIAAEIEEFESAAAKEEGTSAQEGKGKEKEKETIEEKDVNELAPNFLGGKEDESKANDSGSRPAAGSAFLSDNPTITDARKTAHASSRTQSETATNAATTYAQRFYAEQFTEGEAVHECIVDLYKLATTLLSLGMVAGLTLDAAEAQAILRHSIIIMAALVCLAVSKLAMLLVLRRKSFAKVMAADLLTKYVAASITLGFGIWLLM